MQHLPLKRSLLLMACLIIVSLSCSIFGRGEATETVEIPIVQDESTLIQAAATPTAQATEPPPPTVTATEQAAIIEQPPTQEPVDEPWPYFVEEFEGDLDNWTYFLTRGNEEEMDLYTDNGYLIFDLQGLNQWVYVLYESYTYSEVMIEAYAENKGKNSNNVSLICNYSEDRGWYEFNISNGGLYDIFVFSEIDQGYFQLADGGSTNVNTGRAVNIYTAICMGNQLALYINGVLETELVDTKYNLQEGLIGLSVSSFDVLPILVEFDYFAISQP